MFRGKFALIKSPNNNNNKKDIRRAFENTGHNAYMQTRKKIILTTTRTAGAGATRKRS